MTALYFVIRGLLRFVFVAVFRIEVTGRENVPRTGAAILAANHISLLDPPILGCVVNRRVCYMAKEELFKIPVLGWLFHRLGAFPVKRGAPDRSAIRRALAVLADGQVMGMFPEGTRSKTGRLRKPEPGVAMIALRAGVPVIPVGIIGTNTLGRSNWLRPRITVHIGRPLVFPPDIRVDKDALAHVSGQIMAAIARLLEKR